MMKRQSYPLSYLVLAMLALVVFFACTSPYFLTADNAFNILLASTTIALLAIAACFVISSGGIDLSIGAMMAFSAVLAAQTAQSFELSGGMTIIMALVCGLAGGWINGFFIGFLRLPPFIVTLGMLGIFRGLALVISNSRTVYGLDDTLVFIGQGMIGPVPMPVIILLVIALAARILLRQTKFGVYTLALGDNEQAVHHVGIPLRRHKIYLYMLSGFLAAIAGLITMGRLNAADPNAGLMYELTGITAAIIGSTSLNGGRGSVTGAVLGAITMSILQNGMTLLNAPSAYQQIAIGIVLITTVALNRRHAHAA